LHAFARDLNDSIRIVFLPDYNMQLAQSLIAGVDL